MFEKLPLVQVFGPAILIASILFFIISRRVNNQPLNPLEKAVTLFKFTSIIFGFLILVLWFLLPLTASLSTFGYPLNVSNINDDTAILNYLQKHNFAIVRTAEVVKWFLFLFMWWFLTSIYSLVTSLKDNKIIKAV